MGLIEALSYGLPCVVTNGTNMRSIIEEADAGWGADDDLESVKKAMLSMLQERNRFYQKSKNASQCGSGYKWDELAKRAQDEYMKLKAELDSRVHCDRK